MTMRETLRKLTIRITFMDCSSELVRLKVPSDVTDEQIRKELTAANQKLFEDDTYGSADLCAETLLSEICKKNKAWHYHLVEPDWEWIDI